MDNLIGLVFDSLAHGGPQAIIALLFLLLIYLAYDRSILVRTIKSEADTHHADLLKVIDKYQDGQLDMVHALNEIKIILTKLEAKA